MINDQCELIKSKKTRDFTKISRFLFVLQLKGKYIGCKRE